MPKVILDPPTPPKKVYQNTIEFVLCCVDHLLLGIGPTLKSCYFNRCAVYLIADFTLRK